MQYVAYYRLMSRFLIGNLYFFSKSGPILHIKAILLIDKYGGTYGTIQ